jgi:molecular chaperone GrpE
VLEDFRAWLTAAAASGRRGPADEAYQPADCGRPPSEPRVDLAALVGQFTALRHEVNLQTRAVRAQQEQNQETLRQFAEVLNSIAQAPAAAPALPPRDAAEEDRLRPLLKTLVDLYDAVALAGRELQRVQDGASAALRPIEDVAIEEMKEVDEPDWRPPASARPPWWARWFGGRADAAAASFAAWKAEWTAQVRRVRQARLERLRLARDIAERARQATAATAAGYAMTLQRVERAMAQHGLEAIPTVGERFDPEQMEVLEVVLDSGRASGEVVEEVRRGYMRQGRVFRYAQVRVAKDGA